MPTLLKFCRKIQGSLERSPTSSHLWLLPPFLSSFPPFFALRLFNQSESCGGRRRTTPRKKRSEIWGRERRRGVKAWKYVGRSLSQVKHCPSASTAKGADIENKSSLNPTEVEIAQPSSPETQEKNEQMGFSLSAHFCRPAPSPPVKRLLLLLLPKKLNAHSGVGTRDPGRPTKPYSPIPLLPFQLMPLSVSTH